MSPLRELSIEYGRLFALAKAGDRTALERLGELGQRLLAEGMATFPPSPDREQLQARMSHAIESLAERFDGLNDRDFASLGDAAASGIFEQTRALVAEMRALRAALGT